MIREIADEDWVLEFRELFNISEEKANILVAEIRKAVEKAILKSMIVPKELIKDSGESNR